MGDIPERVAHRRRPDRRLQNPELADRVPDAPGDIGECLITDFPTGHGFPIGRQGLKLAERGALPAIDHSEEDGDHAGLALVVPFQGAPHLDVVAVFGGQEIGADQKQDDPGRVEVLVELPLPVGSRRDLAIVPITDHTLPF